MLSSSSVIFEKLTYSTKEPPVVTDATPMPRRRNPRRVFEESEESAVNSHDTESEDDNFETPKALRKRSVVSGDELNS